MRRWQGLICSIIHGNNTQFRLYYTDDDLRYTCSIVDSDTLLVTGGYDTERTVSRYDTTGFVEDLPSLYAGRWDHGCGAYTGDTGEQVIVIRERASVI